MPLRICILINVFVTAFSSSGRTESLPSPTPISEIIRLGKPNLSPSHHPTCTYAFHQSISLPTYLPTPQHHIPLLCPPHLASLPSLTISQGGGRTDWNRVGVRTAGEHSLWPGDREGNLCPQTGRAWWPERYRIPSGYPEGPCLPGQPGEGLLRRQRESWPGSRGP